MHLGMALHQDLLKGIFWPKADFTGEPIFLDEIKLERTQRLVPEGLPFCTFPRPALWGFPGLPTG